MTNKPITILLYLAIFFFISCNPNLDFKETQQVSKSIKESQERKVFIAEYSIENIKSYNEKVLFPIEKVWAEKVWYLTLDSNDVQTFKVDTTKSNIVFQIKPNSEVNEKNYLKKWIIWNSDSSSTALLNDRISLQTNKNFIPDSLFIGAYILGSPYNYKENLKTITTFIAIRK